MVELEVAFWTNNPANMTFEFHPDFVAEGISDKIIVFDKTQPKESQGFD